MPNIVNILFAQVERTVFDIDETNEDEFTLFELYRLLTNSGYAIHTIPNFPNEEQLKDVHILVIGFSTRPDCDVDIVERFVLDGGCVLLLADALSMLGASTKLNKIANLAKFKFDKYLNRQPTALQTISAALCNC